MYRSVGLANVTTDVAQLEDGDFYACNLADRTDGNEPGLVKAGRD